MMKNIFLLVCLVCSLKGMASDTTQVLFLGNSFTSANTMPDIFGRMASKDYNINVTMHAPGGVYVGDTRQGTSAHAYNPVVFDAIRSKKWDYIVIQDNQGAFCQEVGQFPPVANVLVGHTRLRDSALASNPCTKIVLFSGWCFKNGKQTPPVFNTGSEMNERVYVNYNILNKQINGIVSPIGIAWNRIIKAMPAIDLWAADEAHPSYAGSYLAAATIYSSIFAVNPEDVNYDGSLDPATAKQLRRVAYETVRDSIAPTNLENYTLSLSYTGSVLSAGSGYVKYQWYEKNKLIGTTTTPTFSVVPAKGECYRTVATDANGCKFNSVEYCSGSTGIASSLNTQQTVDVYPNPNTGTFNIKLKESSPTVNIALYSFTGNLVYSKVFEQAKDNVYSNTLPDVADGMYILKVQTGRDVYTSHMQISGK